MKGKLIKPLQVDLWARELRLRAQYKQNGGQKDAMHGRIGYDNRGTGRGGYEAEIR